MSELSLKHKLSGFIDRNDLYFFHIPLISVCVIALLMLFSVINRVFLDPKWLAYSALISFGIPMFLLALSTWARTTETNKLFDDIYGKDKQ